MRKKKYKKIALFGGSFNPIHTDHVKIIKILLRKKLVDEVWIMPCKKHAFNKDLAESKHRVNMIKLAIKNIKKTKICYLELKSKTTNYTIKTLKKLKKQYNHKFVLINGSDIFKEIKKWKEYKQLLKEAEFIIFKRKNYKINKIKNLKFQLITETPTNISSTEIRERAKKRKTLKNLVPYKIERYIKENNLYR